MNSEDKRELQVITKMKVDHKKNTLWNRWSEQPYKHYKQLITMHMKEQLNSRKDTFMSVYARFVSIKVVLAMLDRHKEPESVFVVC